MRLAGGLAAGSRREVGMGLEKNITSMWWGQENVIDEGKEGPHILWKSLLIVVIVHVIICIIVQAWLSSTNTLEVTYCTVVVSHY